MDLVKQAIQDLSGVGKADDQPKLNGRPIIVTLSPLPKGQGYRSILWKTWTQMTRGEDDSSEDADIESSE